MYWNNIIYYITTYVRMHLSFLFPGKKADVSVTFRPDHPSELFADVARIELFGKQEGYVLQLKGAAKTKIMYVTGGDEISPRVESLTVTPIIEELGKSSSIFVNISSGICK